MNGTRHEVAAARKAAVTGPRNWPTALAARWTENTFGRASGG